MSILNLNGPAGRPARSKRAVKVWMGIGLVIAVLGVGSTLASTITINSGKNTEFGQGVERTVYCGGDKQISVTPISGYINSPDPVPSHSSELNDIENSVPTTAPGYFYLSGIKVSDIPEECSGVDFVLTVYPADSSTPVDISVKDGGGIRLTNPTVFWESNETRTVGLLSQSRLVFNSVLNLASLSVGRTNAGFGSFTVNFDSNFTSLNINDVSRVLIETQDDVLRDGAGPSDYVSAPSYTHPRQ